MEDAAPVDDRAEPEDQNSREPNAPPESGLGPANAILRAALGDQIPNGPLSQATVPASALAIPIALATENLVQHAKRCRDMRCRHIPPPLMAYRRMRPEAIRKAGDQVHKMLWAHPDHELVSGIRKQILAKEGDLAKEIAMGSLLEGKRLEEVLTGLGEGGPVVLAGVLWASKFGGPHAELLFRSLVPLTLDRASPRPDKISSADDPQLKALDAERRKMVRDLREAKRTAEQAVSDLRVRERALGKANAESQNAQRLHREAIEEFDRLDAELRESEAAYHSLQRDGERSARVNADLRRDLTRARDTQRELDSQRSDLALQLATERREAERLKLHLASVPRGTDAVRAILREEEERIQKDRMILSGGAKVRADQEWTAYRKLESAFFEAHPEYRQAAPVRIRPKSSLRLVALGGSAEVGRSCYLLELGQHRILVDCGIKPSGTDDLYPDIDRLDRVDALILTHAHTDHIGWVPALVRRFNDLEIYCSEATAALLPIMLEDCRNQYVRKMTEARFRAQYRRNPESIAEQYDEEDMQMVSKHAITCNFDEEEALPFGGVSLRFYRAGHILGAASVLIQDQSGRRIFFSGDFSSFPQLTVPAGRWPDDLAEIDLLVLESTYGGHQHPPFEDSRRDLVGFIRETAEQQGSVILASFALGRAQELLKLIATARQDGKLPSSIPVYVDGMIKRINPIYRKLADFDVSPESFNEVSGETERREVAFWAQGKPSIIVTTSGMLAGGPVVQYARQLLPNHRHRIVLTGYQDEGAPSRALREITGARGPWRVKVEDESGEMIEFEAAMPAKQVQLSSHADQPGLVEYASRLQPKHIALVHGYLEAQEKLRSKLLLIHPQAEITCGPPEVDIP